jgi:altronate dehydratase
LGHKIALTDIKKGGLVKKYGQAIGFATEDIKKGDWIHIHNLTSKYLKEVLKNE